ncbi:MAG: hypothetical protein WB402_11740 [Sulfuricaulis sp.]|uniref:hypothetical protein n=1 Tax=Sulfuricaulis sp. TaxID=2003553 RepID=UPI003C46A07D
MQPIHDGLVIDAEYDDGIRSDFTRLARQAFIDFFRSLGVDVLQSDESIERALGMIKQDFNIGRRREAAGLVQYYRLRSGTARKN